MIKLGLSGRIIETADGYQMATTEFIRFAAEIGYQCVELRPRGQVTPETTDDEVAEIRSALNETDTVCAFVTFSGPQTEESMPALQRMCEITEPGNFVLAGRDYGLPALQQLGEKLFSVSLQNIKPVPEVEGKGVITYRGRGFRRCKIGDPEGVDFEEVFEALHAVGYEGYATLIEPISDVMDNLELARFAFDKLSPLCA